MGKYTCCQVCGATDNYGKYKCNGCRTVICDICHEVTTIRDGDMIMGVNNDTLCRKCYDKDPYCKDVHETCLLKNKCCCCTDKRSHSRTGLYSGYIDGVGFVDNKKRQDFYCSACKDYVYSH